MIAPEERDDPGFDAAIMCQGSPQIDLGPYDRSCVDRIDWDDAYSFRWNRLDRVHRVPLGGAAGSWVSDGPLDWEHSTGGSDNLANMRVSAAAPLLTALVNLTEVIDQSRDAQSLGLYFDSAGRAPIYRDEDPVPAWGLAMPRLEFPSILTLRPEYVDAIYFQNPDPSVDHGPWLNPVDETPHLLPLSNPWTGAAPRGSEADLWYSFRPATLCGGAPCPGYTARPIATMSAPSVAWTQAPGIPNATLIAWVNQLRPGSFRCSSDEAFGELMPGDPACPTERADVIPDPADHVNPRMGAGDGEVVILLRDATRQVPDQIFRLSDQVDNELSHETWDASRFTAATNVSVACSDYPWTLSGVEYRCLVAMVEREIPFDQSPHLAYRQVVHVYPIAFTEMGSSSAGLPLADDQGNTVLRIVLPIDTRPDENGDVKPLRHWTCPSDLILDDFYASCLTDEGEISGSDVAITYVPSPFLSAGRGRFFLFFKRATAGEPVVAYRANVPLHDNGPITWNFDGIVSSDSAMPWVQSRSRPDVPLVLP